MAKKKELVMRLFGGLGNQLFQYAFLFALSRQGEKARLEASSYEYDDKRVCELHHFHISLPIEGGPPPWAYLEAALAGRWIYLRLLQCFWKFKTARRKMFRLRFSKNGIDTLQILGYTLYSAKKLPRSSL